MRIREDYILQDVADEHVVVPIGKAGDHLHGVITLNDTGAFLWKKMCDNDQTQDELLDALVAEYGIDRKQAEDDVKSYISKLQTIGCIM